MTSQDRRDVKHVSLHKLQAALAGPVRVYPFMSSATGEGEQGGLAVVVGSPELLTEQENAPLLLFAPRGLVGEPSRAADNQDVMNYNQGVELINAERVGVVCHLDAQSRPDFDNLDSGEYGSQASGIDVSGDDSVRTYACFASLLRRLGVTRVRLLSNRVAQATALDHYGIRTERIPFVAKGSPEFSSENDGRATYARFSPQAKVGAQVPSIAKSPVRDVRDVKVVVIGGMTIDVCIRNDDLPRWDWCEQVDQVELNLGGKGFNQAIAAARMGADVRFIGGVGQDTFGQRILDDLRRHDIDTTCVAIVPDENTPMAMVFASSEGDTGFIAWKHAAGIAVDETYIHRCAQAIRDADVALITLETPPEAIGAAVRIARAAGVRTVVNPGPPLDRAHYNESDMEIDLIDVLIPNEWEARQVAGDFGNDLTKSIESVSEYISGTLGVGLTLVTRAESGCISALRDDNGDVTLATHPAFTVDAQDTTGASDAFCAAIAIHLAAGYELSQSIDIAQAAGALAVLRKGAGSTMPTMAELVEFIEGNAGKQ